MIDLILHPTKGLELIEKKQESIVPLGKSLNSLLDGLVLPKVRVSCHLRSAFHLCGLTGLALAIALGCGLTLYRGLSLWVLAAIVLAAVGTFLALAMITKLVVGEERLIYYHHEVAILTMVTLALWALGQPVLAYLDVAILGVGTFLFCGRVGCFMVGCCHGRPHRWGVRYRPEHAEAGFTPYFVGVRLFPIQLVEAVWVFATVAVGVALMLGGSAPGEALAWYVIVYDVGRFGFEFLRGDPSRPYRGGFSEGQWTSLLLMLVVVGAELGGAIPLHAWHLAATAGVTVAMIAVAGRRKLRGDARHRLLSPKHIREIAEAVELLGDPVGRQLPPSAEGSPRVVHVACTSAGLRLSTDQVETASGVVRHFTFSAAQGTLRETDARSLARLLAALRHHESLGEVLPGREGIFHLVVPSSDPFQAERARLAPTPSERGVMA